MTDPAPPSDPPPGWYPDPGTGPGFRWWDGQRWTETITDDVTTALKQTPESAAVKGRLGPVGPWFSEAIHIAVRRSGHFLPMILLFVLSLSIPTSFAVWYAFRNTVLTFDPDTAAADLDYGGSQGWLVAVVVLSIAAILASFLAKAAIIRQAWAAHIGQPEPWSASVMAAVGRAGRVIPVSLARTLLYVGLSTLFLLGLGISPVFVLLLPFLLLALFTIWVRFSLAGTVAALGGKEERSFPTSWRLSSGVFFPLSGRLLLLGFVALNMILAAGLIGTPLTALAGGTGSPAQPLANTLSFNDLLGSNPSVFAVGSLFNAIGIGVNYVLTAAGTTLLYRKLGGSAADWPDGVGGTTSAEGGMSGE